VSEHDADATQSDTAQAPSLRPECGAQTTYRRSNLPGALISQGEEHASVENAPEKVLSF